MLELVIMVKFHIFPKLLWVEHIFFTYTSKCREQTLNWFPAFEILCQIVLIE